MKEPYWPVRWLLVIAVVGLVALLVPWRGGDRQLIGDPGAAAPPESASAVGLIEPDSGRDSERQPSMPSQRHVTIRTRLSWGVLPALSMCRISVQSSTKDGGSRLRGSAETCPIPGSVELDVSDLECPIILRAHSEFALLEEAVALEDPPPEEVELVLEPLGKLILEVLEVPSPRTELTIIWDGNEDFDQVQADGRWRFLSQPGRLEFPGLRPGEYLVQLRGDEGRAAMSARDRTWVEVRVGETAEATLPDLTSPTVRIEGTLSWAGDRLPDHKIAVDVHGTGHGAIGQTDADGRFSLEAVGAGGGHLTVQPLVPGPISTGKNTIPITIPGDPVLRLDIELPGGGIEGKVVVPDWEPLEGNRLYLRSLEWVDRETPETSWASIVLDQGYHYRVRGLAPGRYQIRLVGFNPHIAHIRPRDSYAELSGSLTVDVADELVHAPPLVLTRPMSVRGQLVWDDETPAPASLGGLFVNVLEDRPGASWESVAKTADDGTWEAALAPGPCFFYVKGSTAIASPEPLRIEVGSDSVLLPVRGASSRVRFRLVANQEDGRYQRFTMELGDASGRALPQQGEWRQWRQWQVTPWLVPGAYRLTFRPEGCAPFEKEFVLEAGSDVEYELLPP